MLKNLLDMGLYLYTTVGVGMFGFLLLTVMNAMQRKKLQDRNTYQKLVRTLHTTATVFAVVSLTVTAAAFGTGLGSGMVMNREWTHLSVGLGTSILLMWYSRYLAFWNREQLLGEYLFELVEQQKQPLEEEVQPPTKEQLVERALKGIRESAASGENKFAHLLSQEEEALMREVIQEFITEG